MPIRVAAKRLNIVLDEFANGNIPGTHINIVQKEDCNDDLSSRVWADDTAILTFISQLGNCPSVLCLGCVDVDTAKYFSDYMGTSPVLVGKKKDDWIAQ